MRPIPDSGFSLRATSAICGWLLSALAVPHHLPAQALGFRVTIIDWDTSERDRLRRAYTAEAVEHEILYCVQSWETRQATADVDIIVITDVQREQTGTEHKLSNIGEKCLRKDGTSLPMIHTHSDGNCQFSPSDLVTIAARNAPFDGVQCGERHFIWAFAWQVTAMINAKDGAENREP